MRNSIDISVIIPVYNVGRYVAKTIESVLDQDFDSYEVILVDDGSKDESGVICDRYAKDNDKISVIHKENGGVMSARFAGLDAARGDYIAFLDGDDRVPPTALSSFYKAMKENPVDYVNGSYINIDDVGNQLGDIVKTGFDGIIDGNREYRRFIASHPRGMNLKLYSKSVLLSAPRIVVDPRIKNNEDLIFNLFLSSRINKVMSIPDVIAHIVERPGSASRANYSSDYWTFVLQWMDDNYKKYDVNDEDYMIYKIDLVYYKLLREVKNVNYSLSCFNNIRQYGYSKELGKTRNLTIFSVRHPFPWFLALLRFHPRRLFKR